MTEDEQHDFIADMTVHFLDAIKKGNEVFVVLSFKHDEGRDTMQVTSASVQSTKGDMADKMADSAYQLVQDFMDATHPKWSH